MYYGKFKFLIVLFLFIVSCTNQPPPPPPVFEDESTLSVTDSLLEASDTTLLIIENNRRNTIKKLDSLLTSTKRRERQVVRLNDEVQSDIEKITQLESYVDSLTTELQTAYQTIESYKVNQENLDRDLDTQKKKVNLLLDINSNLKDQFLEAQQQVYILSDSIKSLNTRKRGLFRGKKN